MSQEKVDKYKEEKANRKQAMKRAKIAGIVRNSIAGIILVAVVGWVGYSGVAYYIAHRPRPAVDVNYTSVADYVEALQKEDTAEDTTGTDSTATDTAEETE